MVTAPHQVLVLASLTLLGACGKDASKPMTSMLQGPTVALHIEQKDGSSPKSTESEVRLVFAFRNMSKEAVVINVRGILAGQRSPDFLRDIWMSIKNQQSGRNAEFGCFIDGASLRPEDIRVLDPGETVRLERDLRCFRMEAGRYIVSAHVDVTFEVSPVIGTKTMALPIVSNEITIEIR